MKRGADATAVANFLASLDGLTVAEAYANLRQDAASYGWNAATRNAIVDGIAKTFRRGNVITDPTPESHPYRVRYYDAALSRKGRGVQARLFETREAAEAFAEGKILYARPATVELVETARAS